VARWALIAGPKGSEKSDCALGLCEALLRAAVSVGGFIQTKHVDEEQRKHYELVRLPTFQRAHLAQDAVHPATGSDVMFCALRFDADAFRLAQDWIDEDLRRAEVVFVGEVSKVEVGSGGHFHAIASALAAPRSTLAVLCVRADQLFYVVEKFGLEDDASAILELPADADTRRAFYEHVVADALAQRKDASPR